MLGSAPSLFRQGPPGWAKLFGFLAVCITLMVADARWHVLEVARYYLSATLYPFQYVMMLPRDAARQFTGWLDTAARIRAESEALQRQRIELAQLVTYASRLAEENSQLRRLLGVVEEGEGPPTVLVELLYESRTQVNQRLI